LGGKFAQSFGGQAGFGALVGGTTAELTGGEFWQGAATGAMVGGLNHALNRIPIDRVNMADASDQEVMDQMSKALYQNKRSGSFRMQRYFKNLDDISLTNGWSGGWSRQVTGVLNAGGELIPNATFDLVLHKGHLRHPIQSTPSGAPRLIDQGKLVYTYNARVRGASYPLPMMSLNVPAWSSNLPRFNNFLWGR